MLKRIISVLLVCAIALSAALCCYATTEDTYIFGDVDGNGELEVLDVTMLQRHLAEFITLDEDSLNRGLVSGGDEISIIDATLIQRYLAEMIDRFPVEGDQITKVKNNITIRFTDDKKWGSVNAYLYNNDTGEELAEWPGVAMTDVEQNDGGINVFSITVDVTKYDRVIFNSGTKQTSPTPVTKASSAFYTQNRISKKNIMGVYPYGQESNNRFRTIKTEYPDGYEKKIYIWLPQGYDAEDTSKRYSVLYMTDGHNIFDKEMSFAGVEWACDETVMSLMQNGGDGIIVVGIDNSNPERTTELTPALSELDPGMVAALEEQGEQMPEFRGDVFADYVANTVIPYIDHHYNTNSIRGFAGSSCGGQEAFYIGMEYPELFIYIGAFSSAFSYFSDNAWDEYLSAKDFSGDVPRMYLYTGVNDNDPTECWIYPTAVKMEGWLLDHGYPSDKLRSVTDNVAMHHEMFWQLYFPEMLCWGLEL